MVKIQVKIWKIISDLLCIILYRHHLSSLSMYLPHVWVYYKTFNVPAPSWHDSSVGRALHRYRKRHGFESRSRLNFFQAIIWQLLKGAFLWGDPDPDPDPDQWSKITWIMVHQRNRRIRDQSGFVGRFLWCSMIRVILDPNHSKGTHPQCSMLKSIYVLYDLVI